MHRCILYLNLASQDALEVMFVTDSVGDLTNVTLVSDDTYCILDWFDEEDKKLFCDAIQSHFVVKSKEGEIVKKTWKEVITSDVSPLVMFCI